MRWRTFITPMTAALCVVALSACSGGSSATPPSASAAVESSAAPSAMMLDRQTTTVLEQPVAYPKGKAAQISSTIVELQPGQATGWH